MIVIFIGACSGEIEQPLAENGILDLQQYDIRNNGPVKLSGKWEFYWQKFLTSEQIIQNNLKPDCFIKVPVSWNGCKVKEQILESNGFATYRLKVLTKNFNGKLAFKLPTQGLAYSLYIDDTLITTVGKIGKSKDTYSPEYLPHVADFTIANESFEIIMHIANFHHNVGGQWYPIIFGAEEDIRAIRETNMTTELILIGMFLILCFYHLALFLLRRKDLSPLYFSIFTFLIMVRTSVMGEMFFNNIFPGTSFQIIHKIEILAFYISVPVLAMFIYSIFENEFKLLILRIIQGIGVLFSIVVILVPNNIVSQSLMWNSIITGIIALYVTYVIIKAMIHKRDGALAFTIGFFIYFITIINDILFTFELIQTTYVAQFGILFFIFSQAFLLSLRFSKSYISIENLTVDLEKSNDELHDLNINLEKRVEERTSQLHEAKIEIEVALDEVETMNENLVAINADLENAQRIMNRDMRMAINVQEKLLPKVAPDLKGWDVAFHFQPMSGVSGDFYDFYVSENILDGVSIFDVSGHGISSGLITMIAKSIIYRNFCGSKNKKLNNIVEKINSELISEIAHVDNYLTGIMLRLKENVVQYVNAGHTELLLKQNKTKKTGIIRSKKYDGNGNFLGIAQLESSYNCLEFKVDTDDIILLYTDCIIESLNNKDQQYGMNRLIELLNNIDDNVETSEIITFILSDLIKHTGTDKLRDDLTIIVLKKK